VEGEEAEGNEAAVVREGGGGGGRGRQQVSEHGERDEEMGGEVSVGRAAEKGKHFGRRLSRDMTWDIVPRGGGGPATRARYCCIWWCYYICSVWKLGIGKKDNYGGEARLQQSAQLWHLGHRAAPHQAVET
jgi:hypothetical protein